MKRSSNHRLRRTAPLKYMAGEPLAVRVVGMAHGLLFIAYCFSLLHIYLERKWSLGRGAMGFLAAWLPFATFAFERKLVKWEAERDG